MRPIRLLPLGTTRWLNTQSVYHALAETMTAESPDTVIFAQPLQRYLCIGYHQELDSVLDRQACARLSLPIARRRVGGGATLLDVNQLFYQCVFHHTRVPPMVNDLYAKMLAAPVAALRSLGLNAQLQGENEIEIVGRNSDGRPKRIAGTGGGRIGEAAVVVGNILFDFDYNAMTRAWRAPSDSFRRLASAALRERLTTLWAELPRAVAPDEMRVALTAEFARALGRPVVHGELTDAESQKVGEVGKRLTSHKWLSLHSNGARPMTALKISRGVFIRHAETEMDGCQIRAAFRVRDDVIEEAVLEGEPGRDWTNYEMRLRGKKVSEWINELRLRR